LDSGGRTHGPEDGPRRDAYLLARGTRDLVESYALGVNAYVVKPVDFAQFVEAVRKLGYFWAVLNERPPRARIRCANERRENPP
jgi:hypothetical protein